MTATWWRCTGSSLQAAELAACEIKKETIQEAAHEYALGVGEEDLCEDGAIIMVGVFDPAIDDNRMFRFLVSKKLDAWWADYIEEVKYEMAPTKEEVKPEAVDHPPHYNKHPSGVECIDIVEHFNFNKGNSIKYIWRAGEKGTDTELQDLKKAHWYLVREIDRIENPDTYKMDEMEKAIAEMNGECGVCGREAALAHGKCILCIRDKPGILVKETVTTKPEEVTA